MEKDKVSKATLTPGSLIKEWECIASEFLWYHRGFYVICMATAFVNLTLSACGFIQSDMRLHLVGFILMLLVISWSFLSDNFDAIRMTVWRELRMYWILSIGISVMWSNLSLHQDQISDYDISIAIYVCPAVVNVVTMLSLVADPNFQKSHLLGLLVASVSTVVMHRNKRPDVLPIYLLLQMFLAASCFVVWHVVERLRNMIRRGHSLNIDLLDANQVLDKVNLELQDEKQMLDKAFEDSQKVFQEEQNLLLDSAFDALLWIDPNHSTVTESSIAADRLFGTEMRGVHLLKYLAVQGDNHKQFQGFLTEVRERAGSERAGSDIIDESSQVQQSKTSSSQGHEGIKLFKKALISLNTFQDATGVQFDCEVRVVQFKGSSSNGVLLGLRVCGEKRWPYTEGAPATEEASVTEAPEDARLKVERLQVELKLSGQYLGDALLGHDRILRDCSPEWTETFHGPVDGENVMDLVFPSDYKSLNSRCVLENAFLSNSTDVNRMRVRLGRPSDKTLFQACLVLCPADNSCDSETPNLRKLILHGPLSEMGFVLDAIDRIRNVLAKDTGSRKSRSSRSSSKSSRSGNMTWSKSSNMLGSIPDNEEWE